MTGKIVGSGDKTRYLLHEGGVTGWVEVSKEEFDGRMPSTQSVGAPGVGTKRIKLSDALGVHPTQVQEATESAKRKGVPTEFQPDGRPIIRSREHQKQYLKAYGFRNNDGGYGD